jgi:hypothetical protein
MLMYAVIRANEQFDPYALSYNDYTVSYNGHYLMVQTPSCKVFEIKDDTLWVEVNDKWLRYIVNTVERMHMTNQSASKSEYLVNAKKFNPSLKVHIDDSNKYILCLRLRSYTKSYGNIVKGQCVKLLITANFSTNHLVWNIIQVKGNDKDVNDEDFLQECQLQQQLIKI